jgi:hypothetical protein
MLEDGRYAGYIFKKKDKFGRYSVAIPRKRFSTKATEHMLTPKKCSEYLEQKILEHKQNVWI